MAEIVSFHMTFRGRVQGVGFRYFARQRAEAHGVSGFVRNLSDGAVELHAEGAPQAMEGFEADMRRGPSFGRVDEVSVISNKARGFDGFEIR